MESVPTELTLVSSLDKQVPALRSELSFRPQVFGQKTYYVVRIRSARASFGSASQNTHSSPC